MPGYMEGWTGSVSLLSEKEPAVIWKYSMKILCQEIFTAGTWQSNRCSVSYFYRYIRIRSRYKQCKGMIDNKNQGSVWHSLLAGLLWEAKVMQEVHVACPCCKNKRLFDADPSAVEGIIKIKCPVCKAVVAVSFHQRKVRTERIGAWVYSS